MRSVFAGGFWALVLGGGALAVASLTSEQPAGNTPPLPPQTDITAAAEIAASPESPVVEAQLPPSEQPATASRVIAPEAEPLAPAPDSETAVAPFTAMLDDVLSVPAIITDQQVLVVPDVPVVPRAGAAAPIMPDEEQEVVVVTRPAEPAPVAQAPDVLEMAGVDQDDLTVGPSAAVPQITPADDMLPAPELSDQPAPLDETTSNMPQSAAAVRVNRPGATPVAPALPTGLPDDADATALARFSADFDYAADLPMMAIVLLDNAMILDAPSVLSGLPFLPTIILNASAPDVTARMRAYRDAGIEVLLQADLPVGALPSDVETTYVAAFGLVPEAIAVFSDGTGPETANRAVADQMMQLIADEGRGFVTVPRGLGGALRNLAPDGVPVANVVRELDAAGETREAIERSLQQAALRARQTGHAVLLGRATPDTLAAIRSWANRSDPSQISLAPVSAILLSQASD